MRPRETDKQSFAALACVASCTVAALISRYLPHGAVATLMAGELVLICAIAPLCAWQLRLRVGRYAEATLLAATTSQIALLSLWHLPPAINLALVDAGATVAMRATSLAISMWFWSAIFASLEHRRWHVLVSLLATAAIVGMLGGLLVFASPVLYATQSGALADQRIAGLLLCLVGPVTYLGAALVVTVFGLRRIADARCAIRVRTTRRR